MQTQSADNARIQTLTKKADFYKAQYDKTYKALNEALRQRPTTNVFCVPTKNISVQIDEIEEFSFKDTFGVEKTIKAPQGETLNLVLFKDPKPNEFVG